MSKRARYMREYRKRRPDLAERDAELKKARTEALRRFADRYPALFAEVYKEVTDERGIVGVWEFDSSADPS